MNISHSYNNPSFGKAILDPTGIEKFCNDRLRGDFADLLIEVAKTAKASKNNDLILDAAGDIFYKSKDHQELGKFTIANPTSPMAKGSSLELRVEKENGKLDWLYLDLPDEETARKYANKYRGGELMPKLRLITFEAIEAASKHLEALDNLRKQAAAKAITTLKELSDI